MENENEKEKKGKKPIVILIIAILLAVILALAIALPLTLGKKTEPKEATITLTATKGSGEGSFEWQKWFSKVGDETLEHTTDDPMTITAKSGETVYFGYSYTLTYQYEGGAYLENLTYNSRLLKVNYILCAEGTNNIEQFDAAIADADWQTWTEATPQSTENFLIIKIEIQELTENETLPIDVTLAVVDGEYLGRPLTIPPVTGNHDPRIKNFFTQINGESNMYDYNNDEPINLQIKEGETIYVGLWDVKETYGEGFDSCLLRSLSVSEGLTVTCYTTDVNYYNALTVEEFASKVNDISSLKTVNPGGGYPGGEVYSLLILKIVANSSITAEELSINISFEYEGVIEG